MTNTNKVLFGLKNTTVFPLEDEATPAWGNPIAIPGAVSANTSPEGTSEAFYADDGNYFQADGNTGWKIELEMAKFPDEWYVATQGWEVDKNGGLVEVADAIAKPFALAFEISGDKRKRRNVWYKCTATRPTTEHKTTEDTKKPITEKSTVTAVPMTIGEKSVGKYSLPQTEENASVWAGFFKSVVTPSFAVAESE